MSQHWVISANYSNYLTISQRPKFNGYQITDQTPTAGKDRIKLIYNGLGLLQDTHSHVNQFGAVSSHVGTFFGGHTLEYGIS